MSREVMLWREIRRGEVLPRTCGTIWSDRKGGCPNVPTHVGYFSGGRTCLVSCAPCLDRKPAAGLTVVREHHRHQRGVKS